MWQNSRTENMTKLKNAKCDKTKKNSKCDRTKKLTMWLKRTNSKCDKTQKLKCGKPKKNQNVKNSKT